MISSTALHLNTLSSNFSTSNNFKHITKHIIRTTSNRNNVLRFKFNNYTSKIRAVGTIPERDQATDEANEEEELEPPYVGFAFVSVSISQHFFIFLAYK